MRLATGAPSLEVLDLPAAPGMEEAPALVLLHEGLGSVALWRGFPAALGRATGRRVATFSRYGHGRSEPPPRPRTAAFFDEEALEVLPTLLDRLSIASPVLVGHSDGASIALIHAARHPVRALVLIAPHVFVERITLRAIRATREAYLRGELRERLARHHGDPDVVFWGWCGVWLDPSFRGFELDAHVARVRAPMLLIQGAEDPYGTLRQLARIEARARGPVRRLVLSGGHSPHLEHCEQVVQAIACFLRTPAGTS